MEDFNTKVNAIVEKLMSNYDGSNLPAFAAGIDELRTIIKPVGDTMVSRDSYDSLKADYIARFMGREPVNLVVEREVAAAQSADSAVSTNVDEAVESETNATEPELEFEAI